MANCRSILLKSVTMAVVLAGVAANIPGKFQETGWPECMSKLQYPQELANALQFCARNNFQEMRRLFSSFFSDDPTFSMISEMKRVMDPVYGGCVVERMGYSRQNGSLDSDKVLKDFDRIETISALRLFRYRAMATQCLEKAPGKEATEAFADFLNCIRSKATEFCDQQKNILEIYLNKDVQLSPCTAVESPPGMKEILETCKEKVNEKGTPRIRRNTPGRNNEIPKVALMSLCLGGRLGYYTSRTGFSFTNLNDVIMGLGGWRELTEDVQGSLSSALTECSSLVGKTTMSFTKWFQWDMCIRPKIVGYCGFGNNVTSTLLPLLEDDLRNVARKYVLDATSIMLEVNEVKEGRGKL